MGFDVFMLLLSLGLILLSAVLFTNAIEMFGHRLHMHQGVVGSILAAIGTALPETVIPIIGILMYHFSGPGGDGKMHAEAQNVAIGAIAGAPFMLGTLAFFVTGAAVVIYWLMGKRERTMNIDFKVLNRDLSFFVLIYGLAVATTFFHEHTHIKAVVAILLLLSYGLYLRKTISGGAAAVEEVRCLYFAKILRRQPSMTIIVLQLLAGLGLMIFSAHEFVIYVEDFSKLLGIPALILSIIITPIATELPEKCNSVIWVGQKKDVLALGNITGAMVFQSCFPVVFGMLFTHWDLMADGGITMASAVLAFLSAAMVLAYVKIRKRMRPIVLMGGGVMYAAFLVYVFVLVPKM